MVRFFAQTTWLHPELNAARPVDFPGKGLGFLPLKRDRVARF